MWWDKDKSIVINIKFKLKKILGMLYQFGGGERFNVSISRKNTKEKERNWEREENIWVNRFFESWFWG